MVTGDDASISFDIASANQRPGVTITCPVHIAQENLFSILFGNGFISDMLSNGGVVYGAFLLNITTQLSLVFIYLYPSLKYVGNVTEISVTESDSSRVTSTVIIRHATSGDG